MALATSDCLPSAVGLAAAVSTAQQIAESEERRVQVRRRHLSGADTCQGQTPVRAFSRCVLSLPFAETETAPFPCGTAALGARGGTAAGNSTVAPPLTWHRFVAPASPLPCRLLRRRIARASWATAQSLARRRGRDWLRSRRPDSPHTFLCLRLRVCPRRPRKSSSRSNTSRRSKT